MLIENEIRNKIKKNDGFFCNPETYSQDNV